MNAALPAAPDGARLAPLAALKPNPRNARTHPPKQMKALCAAISEFGFIAPILVDEENVILAGHARHQAAGELGLSEVPVLRVTHLTAAQKRAYVIADNKIAQLAGWDGTLLAAEFEALIDLGFEVELSGFSTAEIDVTIETAALEDMNAPDPADATPGRPDTPVSQPGDLWLLGDHRLVCGDARDPRAYARLMDGEDADALFTDPPYNVKIDGHAGGGGGIHHANFAMASGEMTPEAFTAFLTETLGAGAERLKDGAIAYVCMDWRHMPEMLAAGRAAFTEQKNLIVWAKPNAGMGSFYRSQHELIFVYKKGNGAHTNTFGLGANGRHRTNVWTYSGVNTGARRDDLKLHPTVKPVVLIAEAIKDVTRRGEIVLDPFAGAGSTLIAAQRTGRRARVMEIDPGYCDVIVRRFEAFAKVKPRLRRAAINPAAPMGRNDFHTALDGPT